MSIENDVENLSSQGLKLLNEKLRHEIKDKQIELAGQEAAILRAKTSAVEEEKKADILKAQSDASQSRLDEIQIRTTEAIKKLDDKIVEEKELLAEIEKDKDVILGANGTLRSENDRREALIANNKGIVSGNKVVLEEVASARKVTGDNHAKIVKDTEGMRVLEKRLIVKDESLKVRELDVKAQWERINAKNAELTDRETTVVAKENAIAKREKQALEFENLVNEKSKIAQDKETASIKRLEEARELEKKLGTEPSPE
jgi:hypothetical protein